MTTASKKALINGTLNGSFKNTKKKILKFIIDRPNEINLEKLSMLLNMKTHKFNGRVSELLDVGVIYVSRKYNNKKMSIYDFEPNPNIQQTNKMKRSNEKYQNWIRKGKENGYFEKAKESYVISGLLTRISKRNEKGIELTLTLDNGSIFNAELHNKNTKLIKGIGLMQNVKITYQNYALESGRGNISVIHELEKI